MLMVSNNMTFDLEKYLGVWYEQGSTNLIFQKGCINTTAEYQMKKNGTIDVVNRCLKRGGEDVAYGKAYPTENPRRLKVGFFLTFFPFFRSNYDIVHLEEEDGEYSRAIVRSGSNGWILSRDKRISDSEYSRLEEIADKEGIDTNKMDRTLQQKRRKNDEILSWDKL